MASDFFEHQEQAQKRTGWLVGMFILAVIGVVGSTAGLAAAGVVAAQENKQAFVDEPFPWEIPLGAGVAALALIIFGTFYKVFELRAGGGTGVAERLGGTRLYPDSKDPVERRLLNVVEEMAIASGTPVPPVFYLRNEEGINAFAAGYSPSDAVLGVTRGCAESMSRDQLQGVIAHEFSHVLNGDMRMSIRLIGILHGILLLGLIGRMMLRMLFYVRPNRSSRDSKGTGGILLALFVTGIAMLILGFVGSMIGNLIKAAVSRQREFLADASAVQFTRNPEGIAGALKRIGAAVMGSKLVTPSAAEASHMYFAQGVWEGITGLMATHPPLPDRIRRIDPQWDGKFDAVAAKGAKPFAAAAGAAGFAGEEVPVAVVDHAVEQVGHPTEQHRRYAAGLLAALPDEVLAAAREPYGARAVVFGLLLDRNPEIRANQQQQLATTAEQDVQRQIQKLQPALDSLEPQTWLPLVDLTLPALRAMTKPQYEHFMEMFQSLVTADGRLGLFEWTLAQVLARHLRPQFAPREKRQIKHYGPQQLGEHCSMLFSTLAHVGQSPDDAVHAFTAAASQFPEIPIRLLGPSYCGLEPLRKALAELSTVAPKLRKRLVDACATIICNDGHVKVEEAELLRGISDLLDCPMPPLLKKS